MLQLTNDSDTSGWHARRAEDPPRRHIRVLIVDDCEGDAWLVYEALSEAGFDVHFERVATEAAMARAVQARRWDIVITDCHMPTFSALGALDVLRTAKLDLPVIVMSGIVSEEAAVQVLRAGAHDFVLKGNLARLAPGVERELDSASRRTEQAEIQRQLELRANHSHQRLRRLFELAPDALLLVDLSGCVVEVNNRACALLGYTVAELIGMPVSGVLPEFELDANDRASLALFTAADSTGSYARKCNGESFPVEVTVGPMPSETGPATIIALRDTTERERGRARLKAASEAAQAAREQLAGVLDCAPGIILTLDLAGRIQFINRVAAPYGAEDVVGRDWLSFIPEADRTRVRALCARVQQTGVAHSFEICADNSAGRKAWYSSHIGPMRCGGSITGVVVMTQDITEQRCREAELAAAQRLAAVGVLASGIAHEINAPLQFVNCSLHFLRDAAQDVMALIDRLRLVHAHMQPGADASQLSEAVQAAAEVCVEADIEYVRENIPDAVERCFDGIERVTTLVRSMKDYMHPGAGVPAPADLNRAIQSTLRIAHSAYKDVADLDIDLGDIPPVNCYVTDVGQVVLNLVINAAHAIADHRTSTSPKGSICVSTRREDTDVVIAVRDTGGGIPGEIRSRIFEPFFTTKELGRGTGQGLAIAWSLVTKRHGGQLSFETRLGHGTTFFARLPIAGPGASALRDRP